MGTNKEFSFTGGIEFPDSMVGRASCPSFECSKVFVMFCAFGNQIDRRDACLTPCTQNTTPDFRHLVLRTKVQGHRGIKFGSITGLEVRSPNYARDAHTRKRIMIQWNVVSFSFIAVYLMQLGFCLWMEGLNRGHVRQCGDRVPDGFQDFVDAERFQRSNAYTLENSLVAVVHKTVMSLVLLALVLSGALTGLDRWLSSLGLGYVGSGLVFFLSLAVVFFILDLPWDYYHTFVLEERFGFNRSTLRTWLLDQAKGAAISVVLLVALLGAVLWIVHASPGYWWLWATVAVSLFQLVLVVVYPVVIAPLFNTFEPLEDQTLVEKVDSMARSAGLNPQGIFQMDAARRSGHSNAYFTGLGKSKRVVLFDTLVSSHTHEEILGVLAHELGHFKLRHIVKSYLVSQTVMLAGMYLTYRLLNWPLLPETFGYDPSHSYVGLFLIAIFWSRAGFFIRPGYAALSRRFERQADDYAAKLMGSAEPLITALKRLARDNLANLNPHPWYAWFHYSHPPLKERIKTLEAEGWLG